MQTLFTRVAQVRGACRCPQCVPSVHGVSRRATGSATRRMPRYLTSSTLCYSGIFAAAATWDAGFKQQRREKWDKAIAEVKQELAQPGLVREEFDVRIEEGIEEEGVCFKPFAGEGQEDEFHYADGNTKADWPANTGAPLHTPHLPLTSIYAEDWQRMNAEMYRWTPKKLAMVQTSVDILLLELIGELQVREQSDLAAEATPPDFRPTFLQKPEDLSARIYDKQQRMRVLRRADFGMTHYTLPDAPEEKLPIPADEHPMCNYREDDETRFRSTQRELNASLQHLIGQYSKDRISKPSLLGKILYNLSFSSAPPNMNTFNILLLGLSRADDPFLFQHVLGSFRRCHMRPNEITLATVLNHFTKIGNPHLFAYWIEMIRGGQNGLALARADVLIPPQAKKRLIPHPEHREKIIQLPYPTPIVFGAIVAGALKFSGFEAALQICQSMGQEGWGLCIAGLTPLLHDCVQRSDWKSGHAVWNQIQALKEKSRRKDDGRWLSERIRLDTFAAMLRLCMKCNRRDVFEEVWAMALRSHSGAVERLRGLIRGSGKEEGAEVVEEGIAKAMKAEREVERRMVREKRMEAERQLDTKRELERRRQDETERQMEVQRVREGPSDAEMLRTEAMSYFEYSALDDPTRDDEESELSTVPGESTLMYEPDADPIPGPLSGVQSSSRDLEARDVVEGSASTLLGRRFVLRNEDVLGEMVPMETLEQTFPRYQSTMRFGERVTRREDDKPGVIGHVRAWGPAPPPPRQMRQPQQEAEVDEEGADVESRVVGSAKPPTLHKYASTNPAVSDLVRRHQSHDAPVTATGVKDVRVREARKAWKKDLSSHVAEQQAVQRSENAGSKAAVQREDVTLSARKAGEETSTSRTHSLRTPRSETGELAKGRETSNRPVDMPPYRPLREEELRGLLPASHDLADYETRERPMALRA